MTNFRAIKPTTYRKVNYATFAGGINTDYDENLTPVKYSKCTYNFDYHSGKLEDGIGIDDIIINYSVFNPDLTRGLIFPDGVQPLACGIYKQDASVDVTALVFYCTDGKLYFNIIYDNNGYLIPYSNVTLSSVPQFFSYNLNGSNALIITNDTDGMWVKQDANMYQINDAPKITSFCLHYERLFVTTSDDKHTLWFSDDLDPTNWKVSSTEAGFISMYDDRGELIKVVSFNDYVYIFREYGISRLTAFASQDNFDLTNLFVSSGRIYGKSIALCGNRIIFLASDGLYSFDGANTTKIALNIDKMFDGIDNAECSGAYFDGNYYLSCKLCFDGVVDYAIIKLNLATGNLCIAKGTKVKSLTAINAHNVNKLLAIVDSNGSYRVGQVSMSGKVFNTCTHKLWRSPSTDFGMPYKKKVVKELYFDSVGSIQVHIEVDGVKHIFDNISTSAGEKRIKINLRGNKIAVHFVSDGSGIMLSNPQLIVGY